MARYAYRCPADGDVEVGRPIGTAPSSVPCPTCGGTSRRVITAPMLGLADPSRTALIDRTEATRSEPAVVSSLPRRPAGRPAGQADPRTRLLPRP
ncbi:zinc ribbon domain-containing protein [Pseudonocardia endophytica]|nr:zinc ribbon domain-containing protein [Pseudonocardia endophytica]